MDAHKWSLLVRTVYGLCFAGALYLMPQYPVWGLVLITITIAGIVVDMWLVAGAKLKRKRKPRIFLSPELNGPMLRVAVTNDCDDERTFSAKVSEITGSNSVHSRLVAVQWQSVKDEKRTIDPARTEMLQVVSFGPLVRENASFWIQQHGDNRPVVVTSGDGVIAFRLDVYASDGGVATMRLTLSYAEDGAPAFTATG